MGLNEPRDEAGAFMNAVGASSTDDGEIVRQLHDEFAELKRALSGGASLSHQVYDVLFLLFELAALHDLDLDAEWESGRERKRLKYLSEGAR
jgi:hypothetical protein